MDSIQVYVPPLKVPRGGTTALAHCVEFSPAVKDASVLKDERIPGVELRVYAHFRGLGNLSKHCHRPVKFMDNAWGQIELRAPNPVVVIYLDGHTFPRPAARTLLEQERRRLELLDDTPLCAKVKLSVRHVLEHGWALCQNLVIPRRYLLQSMGDCQAVDEQRSPRPRAPHRLLNAVQDLDPGRELVIRQIGVKRQGRICVRLVDRLGVKLDLE